ncbi:group I truncated hemoglobin [Spongiibacter pelagi]|nr:group 1 truncated hemoglobin [Spongiibacter pelagi]
MASSLYDRLGGEAFVDVAVDRLYQKLLDDPRVNYLFKGFSLDRLLAKQKAFLSVMFDGPRQYNGRDMRLAHAHLHLHEVHFDALLEQLAETLFELGVGVQEIAEVTGIASSFKDDVLHRPG